MNDSSYPRDDEMHHEVDWLRPSDRQIIREISSYGGWIKPASLTLNLPYTRKHIANRCRELSDHGLIERHDDTAAYRITQKGRKFLDDQLSVDDLMKNEIDVSELEDGNE